MSNLSSFNRFTSSLPETGFVMPMLFVGHGSPMNAIEENDFSREWQRLGRELPRPAAVLVVSAHWLTRGTAVTAMDAPPTIHDFGGFPPELFAVQYPAPGDAALAASVKDLIRGTDVHLDHDWGLDHGAWSIVKHLFPGADIPVLQLSMDGSKGPRWHYELARELAALRCKGVLILASGNMIHNLRMLHLPGGDMNRINTEWGYDWAHELNTRFKDKLLNGDHDALLHYESLHPDARLAIPTPEHYLPLLYTLGLQEKNDVPTLFNDRVIAGSLSMTSVLYGAA
ncbi:MAG: 4,5-DOPA dioxygenase extradiol [Chitinophagaceae bacterium]|nr:MAG: 4,5-DOPA dioxygenase extradiol [Chitinophagaceae bacterium]